MKTSAYLKVAFMMLFIWAFIVIYGFSSAQAAPSHLIEGARKEGRLIWYTSMNVDDSELMLKGFKAKYPFIKTGLYRASAVKLLQKVVTEANMKKYFFDVVSAGLDAFVIFNKKGLIAPYDSSERKAFAENVKDTKGYWTGLYSNTHVVGYNTRLVSPADVPHRYEDLLHPKWKNKMLALDDKDYHWFAAQLQIMGEKKGLEFMHRLSNQGLYLRRGKTLLAQLMSAGEFAIGVNLYAPRLVKQKKIGAPVEWVPIEPVVFHSQAIMLGRHASHTNAAKLFIDYALSREGQMIIRDRSRIPCRSDVKPDPARLTEGLRFQIIPFRHIAENYNNIVKQFTEIFKTRPAEG